jgi:NADH-quinone oxidoreductase subunit L/multicomponent Na+:H+ antiporter subunit D
VEHDDHDGHHHHGGPPAGGWDQRNWHGGESTWFMLGPILAAATGALLLGIVPATALFLEIVQEVAINVGVMA